MPSRREGEQRAFVALCDRYGLKPEHYGTVIRHTGKRYEVFGLEPIAKDGRPVIARDMDSGCSMRFMVSSVLLSTK